ncbi:dihydropteroate synthase [Enterococcus faecalis]
MNLRQPYQIMGIVNVTPDSFSDGGKYTSVAAAVSHAQQLILEGADLLDIGGQSTRPGYQEVSAEIEAERVIPVIEAIHAISPIPISVDTYYPEVAAAAIQAGATIVNDVKGLDTPNMAETLAEYPDVKVVIMHSRLRKNLPIAKDLQQFYQEKVQQCQALKIPLENLCFDPGIGFHKSMADNIEILKNPAAVRYQAFPLLYGVSRKRTIGALTGEQEPARRDVGSAVASLFAAQQGVEILRVHNVQALKQAFDVWQQLANKEKNFFNHF